MIFPPLQCARLLLLLLLLFAAFRPAGSAAADAGTPELSGFATLGAVTTDRRDMWFTRSGVNYPGGGDPDFSPDSLLGLQASLRLMADNDITLQALSREDGTNSYDPRVTLAFFRQTLAPGLSARVGRVRAPFFMLSDSLHVNYANPWVRPPVEVYGLNPFTDLDGIDFIYHARIGALDAEIHPYYGHSAISFPQGKARLDATWGLNLVLTRGGFSLHLGHADARFRVKYRDPQHVALAAGLAAIGLGSVASDLSGDDGRTSFDSVGVQWDDSRWQVIGEYVRRRADRYVTSSSAWYLSVGRRFGAFTPYVSLARQILDEPVARATIPASMAGLEAGWKAYLASRNNAQRSLTAGGRWDLSPTAALKAEFTHARLDRDAWGSYFPRDKAQLAPIEGNTANTLSLSLDLTF
ncbi:hypothetical protein [Aromatoleum anaerobium]|uniref:Porin n=1 Tax=Aromatoleum anaerobium TaxID=182180 RepID=A0ABX1PSZ0_9RHOO|nr:hypothetical protein [Aromatoleum anaerobium]MCK0506719.1 hypothetical protein [Aromatoleum anaerobium]